MQQTAKNVRQELEGIKGMNSRFMLIASMVIFGTIGPFAHIKKEVPLLLASGAAMGINWILLFEAYRYTTVSTATLSYYFAPVIVTVVCSILFHEKLTGKQIICFVMSTLGLVVITGIGNIGGGNDFIGILFGLGAAVFYATVVLLNKFIKNVDGIHRTFLQFLSAIIVLIPELPGQEAAILSYIDPLVAVLISVTILGETMTAWQVTGGMLILGFTLWNEISSKKNNTDFAL